MPQREQHEDHEWYVCGACGMPRLQQWISQATLDGETKGKPDVCRMTPRCKGRMTRRITQGQAYERLGITHVVGPGGARYEVQSIAPDGAVRLALCGTAP